MYCPNCGEQIPDRSRLCGFCGYRLVAAAPPPPQPQYPQQPAPIIVQAPRSGSFFSGCGGLLNLAFSLMALAAIAFFVLVFLCVIRLPAEFPIVDPPVPVSALWSRAVDWQAQSCGKSVLNPKPDGQDNGDAAQGANACNSSDFVSETIPDHTVIEPGGKFTKTWTVRNAGTCTWTKDYTFRFTQGDRMGGPQSINLEREVKPGETYTFELDLTAPVDPGTYTGRWEIFDAQGNSFGWYSVVIDVGAAGQEPQPPPNKEATIIVTPSNAPVGTIFSAALSGYPPGANIFITVKSLDSGWIYNEFSMTADQNGKTFANLNSDAFKPGQYVITGIADGVEGSAVFIAERVNCNADIATEAECTAAGGTWQVIRMQVGPYQYFCQCP